jgi:hypothetical protein
MPLKYPKQQIAYFQYFTAIEQILRRDKEMYNPIIMIGYYQKEKD